LKDGTIDGSINDPKLDIYIGGHCIFKGNITAGIINIGVEW
jgi:hypothetical protein